MGHRGKSVFGFVGCFDSHFSLLSWVHRKLSPICTESEPPPVAGVYWGVLYKSLQCFIFFFSSFERMNARALRISSENRRHRRREETAALNIGRILFPAICLGTMKGRQLVRRCILAVGVGTVLRRWNPNHLLLVSFFCEPEAGVEINTKMLLK